MSHSSDQTGDLQFDSAERPPGEASAALACTLCGNRIDSEYYEAAGRVVCDSCRRQTEAQQAAPSSAEHYGRAVLFGGGAALAGALFYYGFRALSGWDLALISILVGYAVGYAVRRGSGGSGGRPYQVIALSLTYLAIGGSLVPFVVDDMVAASLGTILRLAVILPIALTLGDFPSSIISLLIIGFALLQAWQMNARRLVVFTGPYRIGAPRPGGP